MTVADHSRFAESLNETLLKTYFDYDQEIDNVEMEEVDDNSLGAKKDDERLSESEVKRNFRRR